MSEFFIRLIRTQSVFEALKEDDLFGCRRFAEGDDTDFIFSLGVHDGNNDAAQEAEGQTSLFLVAEAGRGPLGWTHASFRPKKSALTHCIYDTRLRQCDGRRSNDPRQRRAGTMLAKHDSASRASAGRSG